MVFFPTPNHNLQPRPPRIPLRNPLSWVLVSWRAPDAAVVQFAGTDALMYL